MATMVAPECSTTPPHKVLVSSEYDSWGNPCPYCMNDDAWKQIHAASAAKDARKHRNHHWLPKKLTHRVVTWMYVLGVIASSCTSWNGSCSCCVTSISFRGKRPYILGWERYKWSCVFRGHHWPGQYIGWDMCGKCMPCIECGNTTAACSPPCPYGGAW